MSDARARAYERRRANTRSALTEATLGLLREVGFDRLTAEEIATRAGVSRAAFYLHFESKSHAVVAALERLWEHQDSLSASFGRALREGASREDLIAVLQTEMRNSTTPTPALYNATLSDPLVADWFFREQDRALDILLGGTSDLPEPSMRRLRARFHILGRMTLSAMAADVRSSAEISADETVAYLAELWIDLLELLGRPNKLPPT